MTTSKISESCVLICLLCLTCVTYVTPFNYSECISPLGMADGKIKDSQITVSSVLRGTTASGGQARLRQNIPLWGAWCVDHVNGGSSTKRNYDQYIQIDLLNLTNITRIATQGREYNGGTEFVEDYKISYRRDAGAWTYYRDKDQPFNETKILRGNTDVKSVVQHNLDPTILARYIRVHPGYKQHNHDCMRLELYGCAVDQSERVPSWRKCYTTSKPGCEEKSTNTIAMFFVGVAVTLAIVLVVLSVILLYKRRRQTPKLSTSVLAVDTVELQNETAAEPSQNNQSSSEDHPLLPSVLLQEDMEIPQDLDHIVPADAETCPYEVVQISPPSVYAELDKNRRDGRETTDDDAYQKLLKRDSDYVIPAEGHTETYEQVGKAKTPPGYTELDNTKRDQEDTSYQKLM